MKCPSTFCKIADLMIKIIKITPVLRVRPGGALQRPEEQQQDIYSGIADMQRPRGH